MTLSPLLMPATILNACGLAVKGVCHGMITPQLLSCSLRDALSDDQRGAFWDLMRDGEREDGAILALLTHRQTGRKLLAASTHLYWHPAFPDIKLAQAELLCKMVSHCLLLMR